MDRIWFRLIGVRRSPEPRRLNRVGPQGGGPTPAPLREILPCG
ncbi:hypothetical protein [Yersinia massiliensis]|nr:hypothetical protein [Yersinia massiliensis]